jgi:hypothetical protein
MGLVYTLYPIIEFYVIQSKENSWNQRQIIDLGVKFLQ